MNKFLGAYSDIKKSKIVLMGAPFDSTSSFRSGSRFAPDVIRDYSDSIETYSPYSDKDLTDILFFDRGNIDVYPGDTVKSLDSIYSAVTEVIKENKMPFIIGGEHLITLAEIKALKKEYKEITIIDFDAHTDLREDYEGVKLSHATVMRRIVELSGINLIQLGIRSGTKEEFQFAKKNNFLYGFTDIEKINKQIKGKNIFITVDIDVFDPAYVPAVGNPESGGIDFIKFMEFIKNLKIDNLIGADVVELIPHIDTTYASAVFAAKLIRELLIIIYRSL